MERQFYVYIMTNLANNVLYAGVTNDLKRRVFEHKSGFIPGFAKRYNLTKLAYYEVFGDAEAAIAREKQIKGGSRQDKIRLIQRSNKNWHDLYWGL